MYSLLYNIAVYYTTLQSTIQHCSLMCMSSLLYHTAVSCVCLVYYTTLQSTIQHCSLVYNPLFTIQPVYTTLQFCVYLAYLIYYYTALQSMYTTLQSVYLVVKLSTCYKAHVTHDVRGAHFFTSTSLYFVKTNVQIIM